MAEQITKRMSRKDLNNVAVTMRRRSTLHMESVGGGFLGELSSDQEEALRLCKNGIQVWSFYKITL